MSSAVHFHRQVTRIGHGRRLRLETLEARQLLAADLVAADGLLDIGLEMPGVDIEYATADSNGNLVVFGDFSGTVDLDPSPGVTNLTSSSSRDLFVAKYAPSGSLIAAADLGDGDFRFGRGHLNGGITVDASGAIYVVAGNTGQLDLLGGQTLPAPDPDEEAIFVAKLDSTLQNIVWASSATMGPGGPYGHGELDAPDIAVSSDGASVYISGISYGRNTIAGTAIRQPGGYVSRIDGNTGEFLWFDQLSGNIGWISNVAVDPVDASSVYLLEGGSAFYRLDTDGNVIWQQTFPNLDRQFSNQLEVQNGGLYLSGTFSAETTLGQTTLVPVGESDGLVARLDALTGDVEWVTPIGGPGSDSARAIAVDPSGSLFLSGDFDGLVSFGSDLMAETTSSDSYVAQIDLVDGSLLQSWRYGPATVIDMASADGNAFVLGQFDPSGADFPNGDIPPAGVQLRDYLLTFTPALDPTAPRIQGFVDHPDPLEQGDPLSLSVVGVYDPAGRVDSVAFYHDVDGDRRLTLGTDSLVAVDANGSDGWTAIAATASLPLGVNTFLAQATYDGTLVSLAAPAYAKITFPVDDSAITYESDDVPVHIRDNRTVVSTLTVPDSFLLADVDVQLDITHGWPDEVSVFLVAPEGTRVELFTNVGSYSPGNFTNTTLDDEAVDDNGDPLNIVDGSAPFSGQYQPEGILLGAGLHLLDGLDSAGTWTLEVSDNSKHLLYSEGDLNAWSLTLTPGPPPAPSFTIDDVTVTEGDSGTTMAEFTVTRAGDTSQAVSVDYATADDSATEGSDYTASAGTLAFAAGETTKTLNVTVQGDVDDESDETFNVNLSSAVGATIADAVGVATIVDDDGVVSTNTLYVYEIRFESKRHGKDWRAVFEIRSDSDGNGQGTADDSPIAGVSVVFEFAGVTYTGTTDSNGVVRTSWERNLGSGSYVADVVDLVLTDFDWDSELDREDDDLLVL